MKNSILTLLALTFSCSLFAQETPKNQVYLELGGNSLFTGINYERQLTKNPGLAAHIGAGIYGSAHTYVTIPFGLNYLLKLKSQVSYLEFGAGVTYTEADVKLFIIVDRKADAVYSHTNWNFVPSVVYRRITTKDFVFRVGFTPIVNDNGFIPFAAFSVGKRF